MAYPLSCGQAQLGEMHRNVGRTDQELLRVGMGRFWFAVEAETGKVKIYDRKDRGGDHFKSECNRRANLRWGRGIPRARKLCR